MLPSNPFAFKEWAAICIALSEGRQTIILRKGGIDEGRGGFRVAHGEFWLFPTYLHEAAAGLIADAEPLLERAAAERPSAGALHLTQYSVVTDVIEVHDLARLMRLAGRHIWSPQTVSDRFHYRQPGLFVLVVRIVARAQSIVLPDSPHFAGCRSWVELPSALSTAGLSSVLGDDEFARRRAEIVAALGDAVS